MKKTTRISMKSGSFKRKYECGSNRENESGIGNATRSLFDIYNTNPASHFRFYKRFPLNKLTNKNSPKH
ncbi:MAG TPA: hypothetical protein PKX94_01620, partial [Opitutales bacterium]|nr:hypothetical protein [Opitutales bacterium]